MRWEHAAAVFAVCLASHPLHIRVCAQGGEADVRLIAVARYVAVGYDVGGRFMSEFDSQASREVTADDRRAQSEVRKLLEKWHRYVLVDRPGDAEVLIAVRTGRRLSVGGGTQTGPRRQAAGTAGQFAGVQVSVPDDMLTVRDRSGSLLWRQQLSNGLTDPSVPLFANLRSAIEAASKAP